MYSIGILAKEPLWEEKLSGFSKTADFRISGSFYVEDPEAMVLSEVFQDSDLLWIPTLEQGVLKCAIQAVKLSHHVLFGFPASCFPDVACELVELANEARVRVQVGHHENYNPAFRSMKDQVEQAQYIDLEHHVGHCGSEYGNSLFHALMTDVEMCISLVPDSLKKFQTHAAHICDDSAPVLSVRLEFNNGSAASLRLDPFKKDRNTKITVFQRHNIYSVDLQKGHAGVESFRKNGTEVHSTANELWPTDDFPDITLEEGDPELITWECLSFIHSLNNNLPCLSSLEQGCEAIKIARSVFDRVSINTDWSCI